MTWLILLVLVVTLLAALPFIMEALRAPMTDARRADAPGGFAALSEGLTHYQWHGPRSDRVLVLIHGVSTPSWVFSGLIRGLLMMRYRVLSYDLYGRGASDRPSGEQSLAFFTRQLAELLDELGLREPVTLLGYSLGGAVAANFAADEPDRVDRLILLAPAGVNYIPAPLMQFARDRGHFGAWVWGLLGGVQIAAAAKRAAIQPTVIPDIPARMARELGTRGTLPAILSAERHALREDLEKTHHELAAMYIPTLAIWGEDDALIPSGAIGTFAKWNRQARQEVIAGAGHGLVYANPNEVIAAIHTFLREVPDA